MKSSTSVIYTYITLIETKFNGFKSSRIFTLTFKMSKNLDLLVNYNIITATHFLFCNILIVYCSQENCFNIM